MTFKEVLLPAMGEGVTEASIIRWLVEEGDPVKIDQPLVEIATDKVDSEIPSPFEGIVKKIVSPVGAIPKVGDPVVIIALVNDEPDSNVETTDFITVQTEINPVQKELKKPIVRQKETVSHKKEDIPFAPPYVRMIARKLQIDLHDLAAFSGKTAHDSFSKFDIEEFLKFKDYNVEEVDFESAVLAIQPKSAEKSPLTGYTGPFHIEEMGRIRKRIAERMVKSSTIIPHVVSYIEADVTNMANWREKVKDEFYLKYKSKLTFTPLFIEAIVYGLKKYPEVNVSIDGDQIIFKESLNIGMATILPDKDLIVPVVKQADTLNLQGLSITVNDLAHRAREKNLRPEEITGSTFTFTNIGVFGTLTGAPIINHPEAAILAIGAINKRPDVVKVENGYSIGIRDKVMLSLAYDHRIIDGGLGGLFLKAVAEFIENFDNQRTI